LINKEKNERNGHEKFGCSKADRKRDEFKWKHYEKKRKVCGELGKQDNRFRQKEYFIKQNTKSRR
jgi:hypothetical protein